MELQASQRQVHDIPRENIHPDPDQPRRRFDPIELQELADSIEAAGLLQPIIVVRHPTIPNAYLIVAGERRWRAHGLLSYPTVPSIIRDDGAHERWKLAFVENLQRADLTPMEKARGYRRCIEEQGMPLRETSQLVGASELTISLYLKLLKLPEEVQEAIDNGALSIGAGLNLAQHKGETADLLRLARRLLAGDEGAVIEMERITTSDFGARVSASRQPKTPEGIFHRILQFRARTRYSGAAIRRFADLSTEEARRLWEKLGPDEQRLFEAHMVHLKDDIALFLGHLNVLRGGEKKKLPTTSRPEQDFGKIRRLLACLLYDDQACTRKRVRLSYGLAQRHLAGAVDATGVQDRVVQALQEVEQYWRKGVTPDLTPGAREFCVFAARLRRDFGNHSDFLQFMSSLVTADRASDPISLAIFFPEQRRVKA